MIQSNLKHTFCFSVVTTKIMHKKLAESDRNVYLQWIKLQVSDLEFYSSWYWLIHAVHNPSGLKFALSNFLNKTCLWMSSQFSSLFHMIYYFRIYRTAITIALINLIHFSPFNFKNNCFSARSIQNHTLNSFSKLHQKKKRLNTMPFHFFSPTILCYHSRMLL